MAPHVPLHHRPSDGTHSVSIAESPADHRGEHSSYEHDRPSPWREIERDGRRLPVREPAESLQPAQVLLELDGTRIHIHSRDLTADRLAGLAAGLVSAPSEPRAFRTLSATAAIPVRVRAVGTGGPSLSPDRGALSPQQDGTYTAQLEDAARGIRWIGEDHLDAEILGSIPNREQSPETRGVDEGEIGEVEDQPANIVRRQQILKR